jgi:hypothetical protein
LEFDTSIAASRQDLAISPPVSSSEARGHQIDGAAIGPRVALNFVISIALLLNGRLGRRFREGLTGFLRRGNHGWARLRKIDTGFWDRPQQDTLNRGETDPARPDQTP